jgi:hypothetical protein
MGDPVQALISWAEMEVSRPSSDPPPVVQWIWSQVFRRD